MPDGTEAEARLRGLLAYAEGHCGDGPHACAVCFLVRQYRSRAAERDAIDKFRLDALALADGLRAALKDAREERDRLAERVAKIEEVLVTIANRAYGPDPLHVRRPADRWLHHLTRSEDVARAALQAGARGEKP